MATTCKLIAKNVLSSGSSTVTFSSIPATFDDLLITCSTRTGRPSNYADQLRIKFNSSASGYSWRELVGSGYPYSQTFTSQAYVQVGWSNTTSRGTADTFATTQIYVPNYGGSQNKSLSSSSCLENNTTTHMESYIFTCAGLWANTSAIDSITFSGISGFVTGSSFYLYGITKA